MTKKNDIDLLNHLSQWAVLNDELLQAYRSLDLTFQSIIMAIGVALFATMMITITETPIISLLLYVVLIIIFFYNKRSIIPKMKVILNSRSLYRTFFHSKIIKLENKFAKENDNESRYFTQFIMNYHEIAKMAEENKKITDYEMKEAFNSIPKKELNDKEILKLFSKESTGIHNLFNSVMLNFIHKIWLCIIIIGGIYLLVSLYCFIVTTDFLPLLLDIFTEIFCYNTNS